MKIINLRLISILILVVCLPRLSTLAQTPTPTSATPTSDISSLVVNPRATMRTFQVAMNKQPPDYQSAMRCMDLSEISYLVRQDKGKELAVQLKRVIDRIKNIKLSEIKKNRSGPDDFYELKNPYGTIEIVFLPKDEWPNGEWLFSKETMANFPDLFDKCSHLPLARGVAVSKENLTIGLWLRTKVPPSLKQRGFILEHWQWIGLLVIIFAGMLIDKTFSLTAASLLKRAFRARGIKIDADNLTKAIRPIGMLVMTGMWWAGLNVLGLPSSVLAFLLVPVKLLATFAGVWCMYRLVDVLCDYLLHAAQRTDTKIDDVLVPLVRKSLKVFVSAFGVVFIADNLEINITALMAGVGLGGLAFALAARDTVENFFGSITVIIDRPFNIGDWVVIDGTEGTVEALGFRSTRIRTFYNSLITVPNSNLIKAEVDNYGARRYRRWKCNVGITYDTPPEKVEAFTEGIRELVRLHPYTRKDYFHVYLNNFGPASLDILLYIFHEVPDWATELRERHRLMLDIMRLAQSVGVEFAFPTQTLHIYNEEHSDKMQLPPEIDKARAQGRTEARNMVREAFGDKIIPPPPVSFDMKTDKDLIGDSGEGSA
jgi:MscS family membrane protein